MNIVMGSGPAASLSIVDSPLELRPNAGQVLVRVYNFGISDTDIVQRRAAPTLPAIASTILGIELSGVIVAFGEPVDGWLVGDAVFGLCPLGGTYAEYVVCDLQLLSRKPAGLSFADAAVLPEIWFRALLVLRSDAGFQKREHLVIRNSASSVGRVTAILAQLLGCRRVFCEVSSPQYAYGDLKLLAALPDEVIPFVRSPGTTDERDMVARFNPHGVQVVVDFGSNPDVRSALDIIGIGGRIILGGLDFDANSSGLVGSILQLVYKQATIKGSPGIRPRSPAALLEQKAFFEEHIVPRYLNGKLTVPIGARFPFSRIAEAHAWAEANPEGGKVVVAIVENNLPAK